MIKNREKTVFFGLKDSKLHGGNHVVSVEFVHTQWMHVVPDERKNPGISIQGEFYIAVLESEF